MRMQHITERRQQKVLHAFHGTSTVFMDQIKSNGLDPNPKKQAFSSGADASINSHPGLASMGGIYLTDNTKVAQNYAKHAVEQFGGKPMVVIVQYTKNSTAVDEDDIYGWVTDQFVSTIGENGKKEFLKWDDPRKDEIFDAINANDKSMQRLMLNDFRQTFRVARDTDLTAVWQLLQLVAEVVDPENMETANLVGWIKIIHGYPDDWEIARSLLKQIIDVTDRPETSPSPFKSNTFRIDRTIGFRGKTKIIAIIDGNKFSRWVEYGTRPEKYIKEFAGIETNADILTERPGVPQSTGKTLYHGTTIDVAREAMEHGIYPQAGDFVRTFYDDPEEMVFFADKGNFHKAITAMRFHVGKKLGVPYNSVKWDKTDPSDIYRNGAILVFRSGANDQDVVHADQDAETFDREEHPEPVEPGDYYSRTWMQPDYIITGKKLKQWVQRMAHTQDKPMMNQDPQRINHKIKTGQSLSQYDKDLMKPSSREKFETMAESYYDKVTWVLIERAMAGAAMVDHQTGKIYGPGYTHYDVMTSDEVMQDFDPSGKLEGENFTDMMWDHIESGRVEDGFVDDEGKWYNRVDAAKAVRLDPSKTDQPGDRDWLDAFDLHKGFDQIHEDVDQDTDNAQFLINLTNSFQEKLRKHLDEPIYNSDYMFVKMNGARMIKFRGAQFNWPGAFKSLWILFRDEGSKPAAGFHAYEHPDGHKERIISFAVLPPEDDETYDNDRMDIAFSRMVSSEWGGIMVHELQHVVQDIRDIPMNGKGTFTKGEPSTRDYYNAPVEFDAYYHQLTRGYHALLVMLRSNPKQGAAMVREIEFDRDFKVSLDKMLPKHYDAPEFGMWFYARKKQNRRLTKRLYALHQAIVKEMDKMGLTEEDVNHQAALDTTGYWGNAGAGCLIMAADTRRVLVPQRSEWVQEPGTWGTWGGAIDDGEDPKEACLREVEEEAGYSGRVNDMIHLYRYQDKDFRYDTFLAVVDTEFEPQLNWETSQAQWIDVGNWPTPLHFGLAEVLKDASVRNKLGMAVSS